MINGQTTTDALTTATSSTGTTGTTTTKPTTSSSSSTTTSGTTTTKPTTSSSTSSTTKSSTTKSPTTAVPTDSSDDTPATTTGASTSGTTKPSDSSVDSTEPEKVDCLPEVVGLSGAIPMKESTDYKPFPGCEVSIDNLDDAADGGKELRIDPCETCTKKYFCSALTVGSEVSFGTHQFMVRGTKSKYTSTKISLVSGSGVSAYEMFFMINNSTDLRMGYVYPNANSEQQQQVVRKTMTTDLTSYMTNYTIEWAENQVDFFVNNLLVHRVGYTRKFGDSPVFAAQVSAFVTENKFTVAPTEAIVSFYNYTPNCNITKNKDPIYQYVGTPLYYFMENCSNYRAEWVYNDTFDENWTDKSTSLRYVNYTKAYHRGQNGFFFNLDKDTIIYFERDGGFAKKQFKYLSFWMNGLTFASSQQMTVYLIANRTKVASANVGEYLRGTRQPNSWYKVNIPMSKFIINPSNITRLHGIAFGSTTGQFAGSVVLDDIQFNNGSICMDEREGVPIYSNGSLADGLAVYSQGSNFESTVVQYTSHRTVQWYLNNQYDISVGFEAGALDTVENNGLIISVYFVPNADTYTDPNDVSQTPIQPKIRFSLTNQGTDIQPLGIAEYLGGEIPPNRWLSFTIPFEDFGLWESATVDGFKLKTDGWDSSVTQGTLYIGKIKAAKFVPPPSEESSAFILKSSSLFTYVTITLISFILYF